MQRPNFDNLVLSTDDSQFGHLQLGRSSLWRDRHLGPCVLVGGSGNWLSGMHKDLQNHCALITFESEMSCAIDTNLQYINNVEAS